MTHLSPLIAAKWRLIGYALKMNEAVLGSIANKPGNKNPSDRFSDMLNEWLSRSVAQHDKPTLGGLCTALCDDSVGEESLGTSLENAMSNNQGKYY